MQQTKREDYLDYKAFINELLTSIQEELRENEIVKMNKVLKNNSIEYDSIIIEQEGREVVPNIYVMPYYEAYLSGVSFDEIVERIIRMSYNTNLEKEKLQFDFEMIKDKIVLHLINFKQNTKFLEKSPHIKYLDLAIIFTLLVEIQQDVMYTIKISNAVINHWEISLDDLYQLAYQNTIRLFPPVISKMSNLISSKVEDIKDMECEGDDEVFSMFELEKVLECNQNNKMYVLSNDKLTDGAVCILYENVIKDFSEKMNADIYILPSSIHEVILISAKESPDRNKLLKMIVDVNREEVLPTEILSNNLYYYSRKEDEITCIS